MKGILLLSLPGTSEYKFYREGTGSGIFEFAPFNGKTPPVVMEIKEVLDDIQLPELWEVCPDIQIPSKEEYKKLISETITAIRKNNWGKVVISRPFIVNDFTDPLTTYKKLCCSYPDACVYFFYHEKAGCWMGATPETLLKGKQGKLQTMSLAGTRARGMEDSFEAKEEEEQSLVSSYIVDLLNKTTGVREVKINPRGELQAGNVVHFVNYISALYSEEFDKTKFIKKLHPTPAVGGVPKAEALRFIEENEKYNRAFYSGYFGIQSENEFDYFVNLRCMQIFNDSAVLYAGGGITKDSDPESEWWETEMKLQTILSMGGLSY